MTIPTIYRTMKNDARLDPERLTIQQWFDVLSGIAFGPGLVDIAMFGPDPQCTRASSFVRMGVGLQSRGARIFDTVHVLSPPTWPDFANLQETVLFQLLEGEYPADKTRELADRIDHQRLSRLDALELLEKLRSCPDRSIIYVSSASYFRYSGVAEGTTEEETWVTQLARLARDVRAIVDATRSYVLLDAGRFPPVETRTKQLIEDLECGLVGATMTSETAARIHAIVTGIGKGDARALSEALAAITDAEPSLGPDLAAFHRAIAFFNSGRNLAIWPVLSPHWESLLEGTSRIPDSRVELARLAAAGAMPEEALRALNGFEVDTADVALLEKVLLVSSACRDRALAAKVIERLKHVFPHSRALGQYRVSACLRAGDYDALEHYLSETADSIGPEERSYLADVIALLGRSPGDHVSASDALVALHPDREHAIRLLAAREAARHADHAAALTLCASIPPTTTEGSQATLLAIDVLESALLMRGEDGSFIVPDLVLAQLSTLLARRVAIEPHNAILRQSFSRALSIEVLGMKGMANLLYLLVTRTSAPGVVPRAGRNEAGEAEIKAFTDIFTKLTPGARVALGTGHLPESFDIENARRLVPILPEILQWKLDNIRDEQDIGTMQVILHAALLVCDRAGDRLLGMLLFQGAAVHLASTGWAQPARDMADHALSLVAGDAAELRVAWCTFADVYHRCGNVHEALIGALFATSFGDAPIGAAEAWSEGYLLTRLFRDLGLWDEAEAVLGRAVESIGPLTPQQAVRIESLRLSIQVRRFDRRPASNAQLLELVGSLTTNLRRAVDLADDVPPPLTLLIQLIAQVRSHGLEVARETETVIAKAMALVPPNLTEHVSALGSPRLTLTEIQRLTKGLSKTRASVDIAYDIKNTSRLAKRALAQAEPGRPPLEDVLVLLELLADHALIDSTGRELIDPQRAKRTVAHLVQDDHDVHVMGLDERDRLVRLTFSPDRPETLVFEPEDVFSADRFRQWKQELPYAYALMDREEHVLGEAVRRSVDHLGISEPPRRSAVVVCDIELQPFPMNLLRYQDELIGALQPIAMAPSLDWIDALREQPRRSNGRRIAWVSDAMPSDELSRSVLAPLADRLEPALSERGVTLTRAAQPPPELEGAELAIVLAHGGLVPGQRFFQVLRDDHDQQWSPRKIGWALGAAGIVVLFVCSSGRLDEHPGARATIGLVRRLLSNECRAVVACPWPLAVSVPPHWLPPFLEALDGRARVTDAVFAANQELVRRFSGNPPHAFAMHLYGDPSIRLK